MCLFDKIDSFLSQFRNIFSREISYVWFIVIIAGFLIRFDHYGVSSFIRWLFLSPAYYDALLHFFRAGSWDLTNLTAHWACLALRKYPVPEFNNRKLLIGDGIKIPKEAKKMPGIKSLHQESENSSKGEYISGHHFNYVGLLIGTVRKAFCLPLQGRLAEGTEDIRPDKGIDPDEATIVTRMASLIVQTARAAGGLYYATLDSYFATGPMFLILKNAVNQYNEQIVHVITRAKSHYVAYHDREFARKRFHINDKFPLMDIFDAPEAFQKCTVTVSGSTRTVECYCKNYLWKPVGDFIRFVFIKDGENHYILMCSDLNLPAADIIAIYLYRCKIEAMFLSLKHILGGFSYRFWTKIFPESPGRKKPDLSTLTQYQKDKLAETVEAVERFVNLGGIALGILYYLALNNASEIWQKYTGWLRTCSSEIPSEGVVRSVIQTEFFSSLGMVQENRTLRIIQKKGCKSLINRGSPSRAAP